MLPVGTRIEFVKTLDSPADEDHPAIVYAVKGDTGVIAGLGCREGYWVKSDNWPNEFGASEGEFEIVEEVEEGVSDG